MLTMKLFIVFYYLLISIVDVTITKTININNNNNNINRSDGMYYTLVFHNLYKNLIC